MTDLDSARDLRSWADALGYAITGDAELTRAHLAAIRRAIIEAAGRLEQAARLIDASHALYAPAELPENCRRLKL